MYAGFMSKEKIMPMTSDYKPKTKSMKKIKKKKVLRRKKKAMAY